MSQYSFVGHGCTTSIAKVNITMTNISNVLTRIWSTNPCWREIVNEVYDVETMEAHEESESDESTDDEGGNEGEEADNYIGGGGYLPVDTRGRLAGQNIIIINEMSQKLVVHLKLKNNKMIYSYFSVAMIFYRQPLTVLIVMLTCR